MDYPEVATILRIAELAEDWFTVRLFIAMLEKNRGHYFVAVRNNVVLGTIFSSHDGGYFGYLYKLAVLPQYQREGIGSALLQKVVREFRAIGIDWYFANVDKVNQASLSLLAKHGIRPQERFLMVDNWEHASKT